MGCCSSAPISRSLADEIREIQRGTCPTNTPRSPQRESYPNYKQSQARGSPFLPINRM